MTNQSRISPSMEMFRSLNPFEALCSLAKRKKWCWDLSCTTCGCHHFKLGLYQISLGKHPADSDWIDPMSRDAVDELGASHSWKEWVDDSTELQKILIAANLETVRRLSGFPAFFRFLGLTLMMIRNLEAKSKAVTYSWAPQLMEMVSPHSEVFQKLKEMSESPCPMLYLDDAHILNWKLLWEIEGNMNLGSSAKT